MTNTLKALLENAELMAKVYVEVTEKLMAHGVPERQAREEARWCAYLAAVTPDGQTERPW